MSAFFFVLGCILCIYLIYRSHRGRFLSEKKYAPWVSVLWGVKIAIAFFVFTLLVSISQDRGAVDGGFEDQTKVFVIDVSASMDVADISSPIGMISRKRFVYESVSSFAQEHPGHTYAMIVFAGEARTLVPVVSDPGIVDLFLRNIDAFHSLPGGSNFVDALTYVGDYVASNKLDADVILISDGGDELVSLPSEFGEETSWNSLSIYSVGSIDGGLVPGDPDFFGEIRPRIYQGSPVVSQRNDTAMKQLAQELGATFSPLTRPDDLDRLNTFHFQNTAHSVYLVVACFLILLHMIVGFLPWNRFYPKMTRGQK